MSYGYNDNVTAVLLDTIHKIEAERDALNAYSVVPYNGPEHKEAVQQHLTLSAAASVVRGQLQAYRARMVESYGKEARDYGKEYAHAAKVQRFVNADGTSHVI